MRHRYQQLVVWLLCSVACLGCGGPQTPVSPVPPQHGVVLPAPAELPRAAAGPDTFLRYGEEFDAGLPQNLVTAQGQALSFTPAYTAHGLPLNSAAYAGYTFDLSTYTGEPQLYLSWLEQPAADALWIGLANYARNRWDWFNPTDPGSLNFGELAPYTSGTGLLRVEFVVLGDAAVRLDWFCIGLTTGLWYVNAAAAPGGDGVTWGSAFNDLQLALAQAQAGDSIWVAAGTYLPGPARADSFVLKSGVSLYGGFTGDEQYREERSWTVNLTVLSGDIGAAGDSADNALHVVTGADGAVLDGFIISGGNANDAGQFTTQAGGGMLNYQCSPTITNCQFSGNHAGYGGGIHNEMANPIITGCTFTSNSAGLGGGMYCRNNSSPVITDCNFDGNSATIGGGLDVSSASAPQLQGCNFAGNTASDGGGLSMMSGSSQLTDCTFSQNTGGDGAGVYLMGCSPHFTNCSFTQNTGSGMGGGVGCDAGSDPVLENCLFQLNEAQFGGGLACWQDSSPALGNCDLLSNRGVNGGGAVLCQTNSNPLLINCVISSNWSVYGGAIQSRGGCTPQLTNCSVSANFATYGGVLSSHQASVPQVSNCTLWANGATEAGSVSYSEVDCYVMFRYACVEGCGGSGAGWNAAYGADGGGNIDSDPLLQRLPSAGLDGIWGTPDDDPGDLRQTGGSPINDAGDNSLLYAQVTVDRLGAPRYMDDPAAADTGSGTAPLIDMSAFEFQP